MERNKKAYNEGYGCHSFYTLCVCHMQAVLTPTPGLPCDTFEIYTGFHFFFQRNTSKTKFPCLP